MKSEKFRKYFDLYKKEIVEELWRITDEEINGNEVHYKVFGEKALQFLIR